MSDSEFDFNFDASSILGMSSVLNKKETDNSINLKAMERSLFSSEEVNDSASVLDYDPVADYKSLVSNEHVPEVVAEPYLAFSREPEEISYEKPYEKQYEKPYEKSYEKQYEPTRSYESRLTEEQTSQQIINSYFSNDVSSTDIRYDFDQENKDDMKLRLLEKIDNLKEELENDGVNLSKVPPVDFSSDLQEIENTAKLLMLKATRNKYSTMGEDFILALSSGLETICNGKREFFGMKIDLTNCTDIVKVKLRRVKNETSQIVSNVVEKYEIPPLMTLLIELVPALFLHSQRRNRQKAIGMIDLSDDINEIRKYG